MAPDDKGVRGVWVDLLWEPPQPDAPHAADALSAADALAARLGLARVGAAYSHAPRSHKVDAEELLSLCSDARSAAQGPAAVGAAAADSKGSAGGGAGGGAGGSARRRPARPGGGVVNALSGVAVARCGWSPPRLSLLHRRTWSGELAVEREAPPGFVCLLFRPVYEGEA